MKKEKDDNEEVTLSRNFPSNCKIRIRLDRSLTLCLPSFPPLHSMTTLLSDDDNYTGSFSVPVSSYS